MGNVLKQWSLTATITSVLESSAGRVADALTATGSSSDLGFLHIHGLESVLIDVGIPELASLKSSALVITFLSHTVLLPSLGTDARGLL